MSEQVINTGTTADDGTGDKLRDAFIKVNANFNELYGFTSSLFASSSDLLIGLDVNGSLIANVYTLTNNAYGIANTALPNTSGSKFSGTLYFPTGNVGIGTTTAAAPLTIVQGSVTPIALFGDIIDAEGTQNNTVQLQIRNAYAGVNSSTDIVATADNGTDTTNYIDLGINSSKYSLPTWTINANNDGYLYTSDGNLSIGTANSTSTFKFINFFVGGSLAVNEAMRIQDFAGGANVGIGTTNPQYTLDVAGSTNVSSSLFVAGQNVLSTLSSAFGFANGVSTNTIAAFGLTNTTYTAVNSAFGVINAAFGVANTALSNNRFVSSKASPYGLTISDVGSVVAATGTIFVPNAVFSAGNTMYIFNNTSSSITITQNTNVSLRAGGLTTGNRTLAANGLAHIICVQGIGSSGNTFVMSGTGLT